MKFKTWYYKHFDYQNPVVQEWVFVKEVEAEDLEEVYHLMQGEIWSPRGEARELIRGLGLTHTSLSVGDFVEDENGVFHRVMGCGFKAYDALPVNEMVSYRSFF